MTSTGVSARAATCITVRLQLSSVLHSTSDTLARCLAIALAIGLLPVAYADDQRASVNYTLHCQGCHLHDARGFSDQVPRMRDFVGYFLHSQEGREFVIRVPGVATSSLPDDQLTELMNWLLLTYSSGQLPEPFVPFSVAEVAALRPDLEEKPESARSIILERIAADVPALARELQLEN